MNQKNIKRERRAMKQALSEKPVEFKLSELYANFENLEQGVQNMVSHVNEIQKNFLRAFANIVTALGVEVIENEDGTISWNILNGESRRGAITTLAAGFQAIKERMDKLDGKKDVKSLIIVPGRN